MSSHTIKVFGHKVPDTDTVISAIAYAWFYTNVKKEPAQAYVLGELNKETQYILDRFGIETPPLLESLSGEDKVVIVDTNNIEELPEDISAAEIIEIVDHHKLAGGLITSSPVNITMRTMASTASLIYTIVNPELHELPKDIAGIMLGALVSDTLLFRSPTTTDEDRAIGAELAKIAGVDMNELADAMFAAKSDISDIPTENLLVLDSKVFDIKGKKLRISVIETTNPGQVLEKKADLQQAMIDHVAQNDGVDEVLLFAIDILNEEATPIVATEAAGEIVSAAFGEVVTTDNTIQLPGVVSRKKQIIPKLEA